MPLLIKDPLRMCIQCKERASQKSLIRLQFIENNMTAFTGRGRSFYVCQSCSLQAGTTKHLLGRYKIPKQRHEEVSIQLKEIFTYG